ncbi:MAG: hypothetical protein ACHQ52_09540 [Candidatus Eisenbacteria bacterium]
MARERIMERVGDAAGADDRLLDGAERDDRRITRRRFVRLIAAGATAALAAPALAAGTTAKTGASTGKRSPAPAPAMSAKVAKGLTDQKESLAKTLKTLRSFDLPPGSEQGFAFRPLPARRKS